MTSEAGSMSRDWCMTCDGGSGWIDRLKPEPTTISEANAKNLKDIWIVKTQE